MPRLLTIFTDRLRPCISGALLLLFGGVSSVHAQLDAYSAEVAVAERGESEQQEAFELAMREVLLTNSGDKTLLNRDDIRTALRSAGSFVEQFRYRTPEAGTLISRETPVTRAVLSSGQATQFVLVRFAPERIDALIADESPREDEATEPDIAPVSSALIWMLIEDGPRVLQVEGERVINVQRRAREIAGGNGFTLRFPSGDSIDRQAIDMADLQLLGPVVNQDDPADPRFVEPEPPGGKPDASPVENEQPVYDSLSGAADSTAAGDDAADELQTVRQASARYAEPMVIVAHLRRQPLRGWTGAWLSIAGDTAQQIQFDSETLDAGLQQGIDWFIAQAAGESPDTRSDSRFSAAAPTTSEALIWVGSIRSTRSYADVLNILSGIEGVDMVYPKEVSEYGMLFAISPRRALREVSSALGTSEVLRRAPPPTLGDEAELQTGASPELLRNAELTLDYVER